MNWADQHGVSFTNLVNYIPVAATVVTTILSVVLARATLRYAEASDHSLALAREGFEREWAPELHIKLERVSATDARIVLTNLAKISVLLQMVQIRKISHAVPFERSYLNDPLVGGLTWTQSIGKSLMACTGEQFEGQIAASVTFYASGRMFRTDWFRFQVEVRNGHLFKLDATNIPARRVRVLEGRKGFERRREMGHDVAGAAAGTVHHESGV